MRAITIWQPYPYGIVKGWKSHETRSWRTSYRGPLMIHAAQRIDRVVIHRAQLYGYEIPDDLPTGVVVALVDLSDIQSAPAVTMRDQWCWSDYRDGRWAWALGDIRVLHEPVPAQGKQGLWIPDAELIAKVEEGEA